MPEKCLLLIYVICQSSSFQSLGWRSLCRQMNQFNLCRAWADNCGSCRWFAVSMQIYSVDLQHGIGRLSVHGWVGVMHEIRRTANDYGLTCKLHLFITASLTLLSISVVQLLLHTAFIFHSILYWCWIKDVTSSAQESVVEKIRPSR